MQLLLCQVKAQIPDGQAVVVSEMTPYTASQSLLYIVGGNLTYICKAPSRVAQTSITVSAASNANPVSFTATAHNLGDFTNLGATVSPVVKITGYTGNWAALNGVWSVTITSANAFTVAVDSTGFGAVTGTAVFTTYNPRLNLPVWSILKLFYDGSNNLITKGWAANPGGAGANNLIPSSTGGSFACSSRTTYAYQ